MNAICTSREPITVLRDNLSSLSARDQEFARSLLSSRTLSSKQHHWIQVLAERATTPKAAPIDVGSLDGLMSFFSASKVKRPKIRLQTEEGAPVVLSIAGAQSKRPGTLNITDGKPFGDNKWYGRVTPQGKWETSQSVTATMQTSILALLSALQTNPAGVAAAYGKLTGSCCFCARELTDARSIDVGYGPICAGKFNLPWGN